MVIAFFFLKNKKQAEEFQQKSDKYPGIPCNAGVFTPEGR
jgi:hypothetical protein